MAALALVVLTACGSGATRATTKSTTASSTTSSSTIAATSTTAAPATATTRAGRATTTTTTAAHGAATHNVSDDDNGKTVTVAVGDRVVVTLHSTYWQIDAGNNPAVLRKDGDTTYAPSGDCVPGGGCGTATATFTALAAGHARVSASRTSCGEAMRCTGSAGSYFVDVNVS